MKYEMNVKPNPGWEKSFVFALLIGTNLEEAHGARSDLDLQSKISIAYKEAREASCWLRLLKASNYIPDKQFNSIYPDCEELIKITTSIQLSMKNKINERKTR